MELVKKNVAGVDIEYYDIDGEVYMTVSQVALALGYTVKSSVESLISRNDFVKHETFCTTKKVQATDGKYYGTTLFNVLGVSAIVQMSRTPLHRRNAVSMAIGLDIFVPKEWDENKYLQIIEDSFMDKSPVREFSLGVYRADLLFHKHMLIVECDEYGHRRYCPEKEFKRERYLETQGYSLIRFNPNDEGFRIGLVIHEIINYFKTKEETK